MQRHEKCFRRRDMIIGITIGMKTFYSNKSYGFEYKTNA